MCILLRRQRLPNCRPRLRRKRCSLLLSSEGHQGKGREEARQEGEAEMTPDAILGLVRTLSGALHGQYGEDVSHENLAPELAPDPRDGLLQAGMAHYICRWVSSQNGARRDDEGPRNTVVIRQANELGCLIELQDGSAVNP